MELLLVMFGIAAIIAAIILSKGVIHLLNTGSVNVKIGPVAIGKPIVESRSTMKQNKITKDNVEHPHPQGRMGEPEHEAESLALLVDED